jgi:hypothetical protein
MDQEEMKEIQKTWCKRTKEEVDYSYNELGHSEWLYNLELKGLMEEYEGKIISNVPLLMYIM